MGIYSVEVYIPAFTPWCFDPPVASWVVRAKTAGPPITHINISIPKPISMLIITRRDKLLLAFINILLFGSVISEYRVQADVTSYKNEKFR
jgi:hypothetical protein